MNYRELVFRIVDLLTIKNSMNRDSKLYYITKEAKKMMNAESSVNFINNEDYEKAFFLILTKSADLYNFNGKNQMMQNIILPSLIDANIPTQEINLITRAFNEKKLLILDREKKKAWNDETHIPVLQY